MSKNEENLKKFDLFCSKYELGNSSPSPKVAAYFYLLFEAELDELLQIKNHNEEVRNSSASYHEFEYYSGDLENEQAYAALCLLRSMS